MIDTAAGRAIPFPAELGGEDVSVTAINDAGVIIGFNRSGFARWTPSGDSYVYEGFGWSSAAMA